jgi:hypothetical protein
MQFSPLDDRFATHIAGAENLRYDFSQSTAWN